MNSIETWEPTVIDETLHFAIIKAPRGVTIGGSIRVFEALYEKGYRVIVIAGGDGRIVCEKLPAKVAA